MTEAPCPDATLLGAYVDGELSAEEERAVEVLIGRDPEVRRQVQAWRDTTMLLRAACARPAREPVPERLLHALGRQQRRGRWRPTWLAVAATVLLCLLAFGAGFGTGSRFGGDADDAGLLDEIASYHRVYAADPDHIVEVPATRTAEIEAWLGKRLSRRLRVPDLSGENLRFEGGRLLAVDGQPVAQLVYAEPDGDPVALCVAAAAEGPESPQAAVRHGLNMSAWWRRGYLFVVVGASPADRIDRIAARLSGALPDS
jgi:anti-sigma factor RsiW